MKRISLLLLALACWLATATAGPVSIKTLVQFYGTESEGNLIFDSAGNLYGTTGDQYEPSLITVFELSPNADGTWTKNVIWRAKGGSEPLNIRAGVIFDAGGNLYGTSLYGGASNCGTVFKLTHNLDGSWSESNLFDFNCTDGYQATGGVIFDQAGNLYGATSFGGTYNWGVVYQLKPNADGTWTENVLHNFTFGADGAYPGHGSLVFDSKGNLYGTAGQGAQGTCKVWTTGCGTAFKMSPQTDGTWSFDVIHSFTGGDDGGVPEYGFTLDAAGNLYSTTMVGGKNGAGVAFELVQDSNGAWTEKILHQFLGPPDDGLNPFSGVIFDSAGNLYGSAINGGATVCFNAPGCGIVYELKPRPNGSYAEDILYKFQGTPRDGPINNLVMDSLGNLYGSATGYNTYASGTVFELIR